MLGVILDSGQLLVLLRFAIYVKNNDNQSVTLLVLILIVLALLFFQNSHLPYHDTYVTMPTGSRDTSAESCPPGLSTSVTRTVTVHTST